MVRDRCLRVAGLSNKRIEQNSSRVCPRRQAGCVCSCTVRWAHVSNREVSLMGRTILVALTLVAGVATVIFAYPYVRGTTISHLNPPLWLWVLVAATLVLIALSVVALRRSR